MKTALALIYLTFIAALLASTADRSTATWGVLAAAFVALLVAAIVRVIVVTNVSEEEPS